MGRPRREEKTAGCASGAQAGSVTAAGYCRVSTTEQAEGGTSLDYQEEAIRAYCQAHGWALTDMCIDAGVSAKSLDRPALARLRAGAAAGDFQRIVFLKLDRVARRTRDLLALAEELENAGVGMVSIRESIDTSTPSGRLFRTLLAAIAEFEREQILDRTISGKRERVKAGGHGGSPVPFGFTRDGARYVPDELEAPIVLRMFEARAAGSTLTAIADDMNRDGIVTHRGNRWYASTVRHVVENPVYAGRVGWGERLRPRADRVSAESAVHVPIIDRDLWERSRMR
jgi:site-specific DNA recombinase